jgi:hypothetical protein
MRSSVWMASSAAARTATAGSVQRGTMSATNLPKPSTEPRFSPAGHSGLMAS